MCRRLLNIVALGLLSTSLLSAQQPPSDPNYLYDDTPETSPAGEPGQVPGPAYQPASLSSWILYPRAKNCCEGCASGPIEVEVYLRAGPSFPIGGGDINGAMNVGWMIQGGGRTLLFAPSTADAWVLDFGISNMSNNIVNHNTPITLRNVTTTNAFGVPTIQPTFNVTLNGLNRTFVNMSIGREKYLWGGAESRCDGGRYWRWGWDVGGRYGTGRVTLNELQHDDDVMGGFFVAIHSDLEFPCGACIFQLGIRLEYDYIWSDILQRQNDSDTQDLNLLFTTGWRF